MGRLLNAPTHPIPIGGDVDLIRQRNKKYSSSASFVLTSATANVSSLHFNKLFIHEPMGLPGTRLWCFSDPSSSRIVFGSFMCPVERWSAKRKGRGQWTLTRSWPNRPRADKMAHERSKVIGIGLSHSGSKYSQHQIFCIDFSMPFSSMLNICVNT